MTIGRVRLWVVSLRTVSVMVLLLTLGIFAVNRGVSGRYLERWLYGSAAGVIYDGQDVGRRLRDEIETVVSAVPVSLELNADGSRRSVDIDATVASILLAERGSVVQPIVNVIAPSSKDSAGPIRRVETDLAVVSFAVNVDWGQEYIGSMLDIFDRFQAKVTFFFVGRWVRLYPDIVREVVSRGHEVGNHGMRHIHPTSVSRQVLREVIVENEVLLSELTGARTRLFAPPYGEVNDAVVEVAASLGYSTVLWDVDTIDWQRPSPEVLVTRVIGGVRPGSIVLMHPTDPTVKALETILKKLSDGGYRVVSVSDLLSLR